MITVEFLFGPQDGLESKVGEECYQIRFPCIQGVSSLFAWAGNGDPGVCDVYERAPGSNVFVYAGVS